MEIFISGDACISIYTHLCPSDNTRPMALDILWQVGRSSPLLAAAWDGAAAASTQLPTVISATAAMAPRTGARAEASICKDTCLC